MVYHQDIELWRLYSGKRAATMVRYSGTYFMNTKGQLCECGQQYLFVRKNKIYTPQLLCGLLPGILRSMSLKSLM